MFQTLALDQTAYSDRTFCSWERGWRSLLLLRSTCPLKEEDAFVPPLPEQTFFLQLRGESTVESRNDGRWKSAHVIPGLIAMTAPLHSAHLRWRALSTEPLERLELHLPAGTTARLGEELWDRDPTRVQFPDALATTDPLLRQTMIGLLDAALGGAPDLYAATAAEFIAVHALVRHGKLPPLRPLRGDDERIRRGRSYLRENFHRPVSLAEVASEVGMSRYHFLRVFQRQTGETPHRYLTRLRMERAQHELKHGSGTISEIANRCGFASPAHFATAFRRESRFSPSAYRAMHRTP